jgi:hypothetical protein
MVDASSDEVEAVMIIGCHNPFLLLSRSLAIKDILANVRLAHGSSQNNT